jgi:hypothetical protein
MLALYESTSEAAKQDIDLIADRHAENNVEERMPERTAQKPIRS